jgi:predicted Rossmann fold flavoprotein
MLSDARGALLRRERGSILFTHFGLSGPVVLDISRHWIASGGSLTMSFLPKETFESIDKRIRDLAASRPRLSIGGLLDEWLPGRLGPAAASQLAAASASMLGQMKKESRRELIRLLLSTPLPVTGDRGFNFAEVTAGGIPLSEIDTATMESRIQKRLFLCGEILDVDGRIGGYNFQWAWSSGRLAGLSAAKLIAAI